MFDDLNFDIDTNINWEINKTQNDKKAKSIQTINKHLYRRATSEAALYNQIDWHMEYGECHHIISHGDIDSLTFLRFMIKQQKLKYAVISSWVIAMADIKEMETWIEKKLIESLDIYVGEIYKSSYSEEFYYLEKMVEKNNGRIAISRNHSKVMVGFGHKFNFTIESSANINTNPRIENTVITIDDGLCFFYKEFYDGIKPFNANEKWVARSNIGLTP